MFGFEFSDGWTIYIWLITGGLILIAVVIGLRWAGKNEQFDEDIKYLVFDDNDKDKMSPEEFAKYQEVTKQQETRRKEVLAEKAAEQARKHAA
ncbi:MAG: hypothetical protein BMS9Abin18_0125 [Zetaproteobacteria bacterium]|nr:MAG: hypothetical protein BMS9Abin18_0125 [Zetaproteobacteria bacterium]